MNYSEVYEYDELKCKTCTGCLFYLVKKTLRARDRHPDSVVSFGSYSEIWNNERYGGLDLMKWAEWMIDAVF